MLLIVAPRSAGLAERFGISRVMTGGLLALAAGLSTLALTATLEAHYFQLLPGLVLIGSGIAVSTALATPLVLSAAPPGKKGVGAAVNNISQELGVALGVALLGSVLTALYRGGLSNVQLPERVQERAVESIGAALQLAQETDAEFARTLAIAARQAFTGGFQAALVTATNRGSHCCYRGVPVCTGLDAY